MPYRKIIHIDMDAFYASVEQRDHPELRGKPVVVGGAPAGRGVVAAASYEARKFGIHSAMPAYRAIRLCPGAIFIKPRFEVYKSVSHEIREIFHEYTDLVEPLSLDEAYLDISENKKGITSARKVAEEIRKKIRQQTGLTASAGVAVNKFVAKLASDLHKPDGLCVITPEKMIPFLEQLPLGKFHGIGKATEEKMHQMGLYTGADLKALSEPEMVSAFGKPGRFYFRIVRGDDTRPVQPDRIRKSVGAENTYSEDLSKPDEIRGRLSEIAKKVSGRLQNIDAAGKTITLKVRYDNFETITRSFTHENYLNEEEKLYETGEQLLSQTEAGERSVRLLGLSVSNLNLHDGESKSGTQLELELKYFTRRNTDDI